MEGATYLFQKTISSMNNKQEALRESILKSSFTGSSTRMLNPDRVSKFDELWKLMNILTKSRRLSEPNQNSRIQVGHRVTMISQDNKEIIVHLCSKSDVMYCTGINKLSGRLLSIESPFGKLLLGKRVDGNIQFDQQNFKITEIEVSEYV